MHKECRSVGEAEGHNNVLIKTVSSGERGLRNIFLLYLELMISSPQINFSEYFRPTKLIKQIVDPRQWILVFDGNVIQLSVVYTHS